MGLHHGACRLLAAVDLDFTDVRLFPARALCGGLSPDQYRSPHAQHPPAVPAFKTHDPGALAQRPGRRIVCLASAPFGIGGLGDRTEGRLEHLLSATDRPGLFELREKAGGRKADPVAHLFRPGPDGQTDARHPAVRVAVAGLLAIAKSFKFQVFSFKPRADSHHSITPSLRHSVCWRKKSPSWSSRSRPGRPRWSLNAWLAASCR